uniref:Uncharacterized protein n=1 Tax=Ascaris lumbricoides TaxID=6252 RepID=A0A0M3HTP1_ASCLU
MAAAARNDALGFLRGDAMLRCDSSRVVNSSQYVHFPRQVRILPLNFRSRHFFSSNSSIHWGTWGFFRWRGRVAQ